MKSIIKELKKPLRVYFCGHSLGAALAVLAALDLSVNLNYILDALETVYGLSDGNNKTYNDSFNHNYNNNYNNDNNNKTYNDSYNHSRHNNDYDKDNYYNNNTTTNNNNTR